jgi:tetratricopeptide (TPR) repeat protein
VKVIRLQLAALALATTVLAAGVLSRCSRPDTAGLQGDDAAVVDTELLAFLSLARAHHHEANVLEESGDLPGAIAALRKITVAPKPHPGERLPEVEEVLADAYARMAELELRAKDSAGARRDVEAGLVHAPDPTYFRGHLLEVYGIVEEGRAAELRDAGDDAEAERARQHALVLLRDAVKVQEGVIGRLLDAGTPDGGAP